VTIAVICGYALGVLAGWSFSRSERVAAVWRKVIRGQIVLVSVFVSLLAAWRLPSAADLLWPIIGGAIGIILVAVALIATPRGSDRLGRAVLRGWSASPNGGFWAIPVATAVAGAAATVFAVLIDRVLVVIFGVMTWLLRRDAPLKQQKRTSWIDQAPVIALIIGLVLNYFSDAPEWTADALEWSAPVMAMAGAAVFVGSVLHPSQRIAWRAGVKTWTLLVVVRVALFVPLALISPEQGMHVVFLLFAFSIPAFFPPQLSILYGYRDPVVAAAVRWGWIFAPVGIAAAVLAARA